MNIETEAAELVRLIVAPHRAGESVKELIWLAARKTGLSAARVKRIWYGEARKILADEMDALRRAAGQKGGNGGDDDTHKYVERLETRLGDLGNEMASLAEEIRELNARLARTAPAGPRRPTGI